MTQLRCFVAFLSIGGLAMTGQTGPKDDVRAAAKKLAEKANYSWKSSVDSPDSGGAGGRFRVGPTEGKTEKDGFTYLAMVRGENTIEAVLKGSKGALNGPNGWIGLAEAAEPSAGGQRNAAAFLARSLQSFRAPAAQVEDLISRTKELKKTGDGYAGDLSEEGAKGLLMFGRRGGNVPEPTNARGTVKFWLRDGAVAKYQFTVQGTVTFNNNDVNVDRTTIVEIKDVDATKVDVPEDAKKKMSSVSA